MEKITLNKQLVVDKTQRYNPRNERLRPFVERINASRKAGGYRPYPASMIGSKMSHIATEDLVAHYKMLDQSNNFSALWHWYNTNPKKKK